MIRGFPPGNYIISTHAPLAGRDNGQNYMWSVATGFQPTRPLRGATIQRLHSQRAVLISTHAPLAGRDKRENVHRHLLGISTHAPLAGRDLRDVARHRHVSISTHAPLAGRDCEKHNTNIATVISTHAPLAGRDDRRPRRQKDHQDFNPRAPCGARRNGVRAAYMSARFQPTRPLRGATRFTRITLSALSAFQPTRPLRGATDMYSVSDDTVIISTHAPLAGRDHRGRSCRAYSWISTHAPLAGRDVHRVVVFPVRLISTHAPLAGRDISLVVHRVLHRISTHAPLAGRD